MTANGYNFSFGVIDQIVLRLDYSDGCTTLNILKTTEVIILLIICLFSQQIHLLNSAHCLTLSW